MNDLFRHYERKTQMAKIKDCADENTTHMPKT
jgi:hypothetical protein